MMKRIGLLVPAMNITFETDFALIRPNNITIHSHRLWFPESVENQEVVDNVNSGIEESAQYLKLAKVNVIAYGFTTGSFYRGLSYSYDLINRIESATNTPAVVPSVAILEALKYFNVNKISIATPYPEWNNDMFLKILNEAKYNVVNLKGDERSAETAIKQPMWDQEPEEIIKFCKNVFDDNADVLLCPCTAWRSFEIVEALEQVIGKPVITANQATIWMTFNRLGIFDSISGFGKLLKDMPKTEVR